MSLALDSQSTEQKRAIQSHYPASESTNCCARGKAGKKRSRRHPRRRLAEADRLRAAKLPQLSTRTRARRPNLEKTTAPVTMADKKPAGPPEAITNAAAGCATRRPTRPRHISSLHREADAAPRLREAPRRRRAARRASRNRYITQAKTPHRPRRRSRRPSALLMRTAAGSSRSSRAIRRRPGP